MVEGILSKGVETLLFKCISKITVKVFSDLLTKNSYDITQLEKEVVDFAKRKFESNFKHLDWSQEIDFEGLLEYINSSLTSDINRYFRATSTHGEEQCLVTILGKAHYHSHANSNPKKSVIDNFIKAALSISKEYYLNKIPTEYFVIGKAMAEIVSKKFEPNIVALRDDVIRQNQIDTENNVKTLDGIEVIQKQLEDIREGLSLEKFQLDKQFFCGFMECRKLIFDITSTLLPAYDKETQSSPLDILLFPLLKNLLGMGPFSDFNLQEFAINLREVHNHADILNVTKCRWDAINLLYKGKRTETIAALNTTYSACENNKNVPQWIKASILIDIRNLYSFFEDEEEYMQVQNEISTNSESVHFPTLDRFERNMYSGLVNWHTNDSTKSIYSNELTNGIGMYRVSEAILNAFITAAFYGSITHLWEVNLMLKKALFFINCKYKDRNSFVNYYKSCLISWESVDKRSFENIFIEHFYLLSQEDIKTVFSNLQTLPLLHKELSSKLIAMRFTGNYMNGETFNEALADCLKLISEYSKNKRSLYYVETVIVDFVKYNVQRIPISTSVKLILSQLKSSPEHMSRITISALFNANFSEIDDDSYSLLTHFIASTVNCWNKNIEYLSVMIRMSLSELRHENFDELIKRVAPLFYRGNYSFNIAPNPLPSEVINDYLERISTLSKSKEKTRMISSSDSIDFAELFNTLAILNSQLDSATLSKAASELEKSILASFYDFNIKVLSIETLSLLYLKYSSESAENVARELFMNKSTIPDTNRFFNGIPLDVFVDFLGVIIDQITPIDFAFALLDVKRLRMAGQIRFYEMLSSVAIHWNFSQKQNEIFTNLVFFLLDGVASDIHDIRHYSIRALLGLAQANPTSTLKERTLTLLHEIYDFESPANKTFIIDGMSKIDSSSALTIDVLQKANADTNYHVRVCNTRR